MILGSPESLLFLAAAALGARLLAAWRGPRTVLLLAASYAFYALAGLAHLPLLLVITASSFAAGLGLKRVRQPGARRLILVLACLVNCGLLFFYKYVSFFLTSLHPLLGPYFTAPSWVGDIALPLGLSYIVFQCTGYVIDVYRDPSQATGNLAGFSLFASFFPVVSSGPILRAGEFLSQLGGPRPAAPDAPGLAPQATLALEGAERILRGMVKKSLLAGSLATYVDAVYAAPGSYGALNHVLAAYAFAWQIYFDFSGYTDIALGAANLLGWRLRENFNLPYLASNPSDYWRRWHMSLSQWLRDYLYIPLGGSKRSRLRTYLNAVGTMAICGLWHGAAWTYVVWGVYQGLWIALHRYLVRERDLIRVPRWLAVAASFHLTCLGYVLFRSADLGQAWVAYSSLWRAGAPAFAMPSWEVWLCLALGPLTHLAASWSAARALWGRLPLGIKALAYACALALIFLWAPRQEAFIYAQF